MWHKRFFVPHVVAGSCFVLLQLAPGLTPQDLPLEDMEERIRAIGERAAASDDVTGLSMAVAFGSEILVADGWGYSAPEDSDPATATSAYRVGSLTLQLTSIAALQLVEAKRLDLDASVVKLVPELAGEDGGLGGVKLRHLLQQTSGLPSYSTLLRGPELRGKSIEPELLLERLREAPLEFEPGSCFDYSNTNVFLLGLIVERTAEQDFQGYVESRIFKPLDLEDTLYCFTGPPIHAQAGAVQEVPGGSVSEGTVPQPFSAVGLCSTAVDLLALQRGLVEREILGEKGFSMLTNDAELRGRERSHFSSGMTRVVVGDMVGWSYGGGLAGSRVHVAWYPSLDLSIVVVAHGEDAPVDLIERRVARAILDIPEPGVQDLEVPEDVVANCEGTFNIGCSSYIVRESNGRLVVLPPDAPVILLLYQGRLEFVASHDSEVRFVFNTEEGLVVSFTLYDRGTESLAQRMN